MTPLSPEQLEERLGLAARNVERARKNVARQQWILESLRKQGYPTAQAEILLDRLECSVRAYEGAERQLLQMVERSSPI